MNNLKANLLKPVLICLLCIISTHTFSQDKNEVSLTSMNVVQAPGMNIYNILPILEARQKEGHTQIAFFITGNYVSLVPARKIKPDAKIVYDIDALRKKLESNNWSKIKFEIVEMTEEDANRYVSRHSNSPDAKDIVGIKNLVIIEAKSGDAAVSMNGLDMAAKICPPPLNCNTSDPSTD